MSIYVIFEQVTESNRQYVTQIYRTSVYTSQDVGDAIEFDTIDEAKIVRDLVARRNKSKIYRILEIVKTTNIID